MTTNPPPLTAHDVELLVRGYDVPVKPEESERRDYLMDTFIHMDNREVIEAYAAQQNAELVAENNKLLHDIRDIKRKLNDRITSNQILTAENERLKQQLAWQPIAGAPKDGTLVELYQATEPSEHRISCCFWDDYEYDGWVVNDNKHFMPLRGPSPTHYRIPQPPKEAT